MKTIHEIDLRVLNFIRKISIPFAHFALFVIFFWFGLLKVVGLSPAGALVENLFNQTVPFIPFDIFYILFGLFECLIGVLFLIRGAQRLAIILLLVHMVTTFMPLFMLPESTWNGFLVPTLEGQYIIKNLVILSTALAIATNLIPLHKKVNPEN